MPETTPNTGHPGSPLFQAIKVPAAFLLAMTVLLAVVWMQPRSGSDVVVLANPWSARSAATEITLRAGGEIVDTGRWPFVIVARTAPAQPSPFPHRLYAAGAFLVLDAGMLAGCLSRS